MIKNERQYKVTKSQVDKFEKALLEHAKENGAGSNKHPLLVKAQKDALISQLKDLKEEVEEYERLRSGEQREIATESFDDFLLGLIKSRIALGYSQKKLAEMLGIKEQQVQRYEATEYSSASADRIKEVISALGITVLEKIILPAETGEKLHR